ncbi:MAG: hypothetical protein WA771_09075 [Chthoniobacterales bacterium]
MSPFLTSVARFPLSLIRKSIKREIPGYRSKMFLNMRAITEGFAEGSLEVMNLWSS